MTQQVTGPTWETCPRTGRSAWQVIVTDEAGVHNHHFDSQTEAHDWVAKLSNEPLQVTIIHADDWGGIYVGGKLWTEGHSIPRHEWVRLLELAGVSVLDLSESDNAYDAIEAAGRCPSEWPPS